MVGRKFANLSCCVLFFLGFQVERAHTPRFDESRLAMVQGNSVLLPLAEPTNSSRHKIPFVSEADKEKLRDFLSIPLKLPNKFISWSHNVKAFLDMPGIQQNCLTTAVYFEARSESELGQLAVAMVVLNRAQTSNASVCGVVYKGADQFNACQFSFACDGKPDVVDDTRAWKTSNDIATMALVGGATALRESVQVLTIATNYHADYVNPKWSKSLTRLTQIGRHIFYSERPATETAGTRKNYI